jgi:hypothetical protein
MAGVEGLGNVWGGEFDNHPLTTFARILYIFETKVLILSESFFSSENRWNEDFCEFVHLEEELKECSSNRWRMDEG